MRSQRRHPASPLRREQRRRHRAAPHVLYRQRLPVAALLALALLAWPGAARADQGAADQLSREGDQLAAAGDDTGALARYKAAAEQDHDAKRLCPIGLAYYRLGKAVQAEAFLGRCLAEVDQPSADQSAAHRALRHQLGDGKFGIVAVSSRAAGARATVSDFAADDHLPLPVEIYLPFGPHRIQVSADGYQERTLELTVDARARYPLPVTLERTAGPSTSNVDFGEEEPAAAGNVITAPPKPKKQPTLLPVRYREGEAAGPPEPGSGLADPLPTARDRRSPLPWLLIGGGSASLVGAIGLHIAHAHAASDRDALPEGAARDSASLRAKRTGVSAIALYAIGTVSVGVGVTLLVHHRGRKADTHIAAQPIDRGALISIRFSR